MLAGQTKANQQKDGASLSSLESNVIRLTDEDEAVRFLLIDTKCPVRWPPFFRPAALLLLFNFTVRISTIFEASPSLRQIFSRPDTSVNTR
jgi:hypothetical protein